MERCSFCFFIIRKVNITVAIIPQNSRLILEWECVLRNGIEFGKDSQLVLGGSVVELVLGGGDVKLIQGGGGVDLVLGGVGVELILGGGGLELVLTGH